MTEYTVKFKRVDTGKSWIAGNCKDGKYGPRIGMKLTPELKAYLDSVVIGQWLNFDLYEPNERKESERQVDDVTDADFGGDSIPF